MMTLLTNVRKIVSKRVKVAKYFSESIKNSKTLVEQKTPKYCTHTNYTFAAKLLPSALAANNNFSVVDLK